MPIIGIDCATKPESIGIALATWHGEGIAMRVQDLRAGTADPWAEVAEWILGSDDRSKLIAIDAPLGWPRPLAETLGRHKAGDPVEASADELFSRTTDQKIRARFGPAATRRARPQARIRFVAAS